MRVLVCNLKDMEPERQVSPTSMLQFCSCPQWHFELHVGDY